MMPRKKKDALQPERVKTSALVKEPTKAKGKTKAKAAAEEEPHYDIPHLSLIHISEPTRPY